VAGCQTARAVAVNLDRHIPATVMLLGHAVPADRSAVQAEVLGHVAVGLPVEAARAGMEELGFACLYGGFYDKKPCLYLPDRTLQEMLGSDSGYAARAKRFHSLVCTTAVNEVGNWSQFYSLAVTLPYDEEGRVTAVEVSEVLPTLSRYAAFFRRRPELPEPIGLSVEKAGAMMEAHQFCCAYAHPDKQAGDRRPYLDCYAYDERLLDGDIVRVHLFYDQAGRVTEAEVIQEAGYFDGLRCMLPNRSDSLAGGVLKAAVFPVRLSAVLMLVYLAAGVNH
jgi:hypothetical protein